MCVVDVCMLMCTYPFIKSLRFALYCVRKKRQEKNLTICIWSEQRMCHWPDNHTASSTMTRKYISLSDISPLIICSRPQWGWDHANVDVRDTGFMRGNASCHLLHLFLEKPTGIGSVCAAGHSRCAHLRNAYLACSFLFALLIHRIWICIIFRYFIQVIYTGYSFIYLIYSFITAPFLISVSDICTINNAYSITCKVSNS